MEDMSNRLHEGMEVRTTDGAKVGKIKQVWYGTTVGGPMHDTEETCIEVHRGLFGRDHLYLPCHLVADVQQNVAILSVDDQTLDETAAWHRKPAWAS